MAPKPQDARRSAGELWGLASKVFRTLLKLRVSPIVAKWENANKRATTVTRVVNDDALDVLFRKAHTHRKWRPEPVTKQLLMAVYDLMRWGPTTNNTSPARITFIVSHEAKERLKPHLNKGNVEQTMLAPATAIIAYDLAFYEMMPK